MDNQSAIRIKRKLAEEFRQQLTYGIPTAKDEAGLRRLANQLREKKVVVKYEIKNSHTVFASVYFLLCSSRITLILLITSGYYLVLKVIKVQMSTLGMPIRSRYQLSVHGF